MGGFSFTTDLNAKEEMFYINLPWRTIWLDAIRAAGEVDMLENARCLYDEDGQCELRGCLNRDGKRGWQIPLRDLLSMNQRVLSFVELYPDRLPSMGASKSLDANGDILR